MNTTSSPHYWRDVILTALAPAIWGSTYIVTSEILPPDRPFTAALIRVLPAGLLLLLFTRRFPARQDWWRVVVLSALNIGVFQALLFVAAYRLPGGLAAVLGAIQPLLVMVLVWVVDHRAPRLATLWSAIIGVGGMAILLLSPQTTFEPVGVAAALLGAVCMATGVWLTRRWQLDLPVLPLTGWQLFIGGLMLAPVAWVVDAPLPALTLSQYVAYTYLCLAGAVISYGLWFRGIARLPTVAVASLGLLSPLTAVVLGWVLLSQSMTGTACLGLAIVLASVFAVQWTTARGK
ncbi:EamA family transporter [Pectobacterium parvum]|uniref:EamA family transporter n=1 Tax=Pectobacterium parvum TaxID=2778550 RepID=A0AAP9III2_9GAMM|nr:EamA family transporter [Pectobacterium parvum]KFX18819.1 ABC transporter permease [Pectobacterium parvum]QHQ25730.1 EamA family transporter [Pectobacterium parvum]UFK37586.1 EamA family transporter [Pectobacterium parvum]